MKAICEMNSRERVELKRKSMIFDNVALFFEGITLFGFVMLLAGCAGNIAH